LSNIKIDLETDPRFALGGKIVTMDDQDTVYEKGVIYIEKNKIVAVQSSPSQIPTGFENVPVIKTGGTIYPGLIELHNHLSYNILPLWDVPKIFTNRGQWARHPEKRKLITAPMHVLGRTPGYIEAIVRYVECKCLVAGVTTSQGITLSSSSKIKAYYSGVVRNVERTNNPDLPNAGTRIDDIDSEDASKFLKQLQDSTCKLLHLSEGIDERSRDHFEALEISDGKWAITNALAGIHSVALRSEDYQIMKEHEASIVWSPLSNLLLYGQTADIYAAKDAGILIGIGSDWSPSGSKNLLCELKVAQLYSKNFGGIFTNKEILAMATKNAAKILKWQDHLGSIERNKLADLIVVNGRRGDPYKRLINARETSITFVVIDGIPRCGQKRFMTIFGYDVEEIDVGSTKRVLNLTDDSSNPIIVDLSYTEAKKRLQEGLRKISTLAQNVGDIDHAIELAGADVTAKPIWFLSLEQDEIEAERIRPHISFDGQPTGFLLPLEAVDYPELLADVSIKLDPLEIGGDKNYFMNLAIQINLPDFIKSELPPLYGVEPILPESAEFLRNAHPQVVKHFASTVELSTFLNWANRARTLTLGDRKRIVEQALVLMENVYVHMPLKSAMHAIDPVQKLRLLQYQLEQRPEELLSEIDFHNEMTTIFTSTRDLHTNYLLPSPFRDNCAFLPFMIEECYKENKPKYIVTKIMKGFSHETFKEGVEIQYWNGIPIRRAIEINAERQAGSNPHARFARGLDALTIRPMIRVLPPDEEWVTIHFLTKSGELKSLEQKWLVTSMHYLGTLFQDSLMDVTLSPEFSETTAFGLDLQTDAIHQFKKLIFAPEALEAEKQIAFGRPQSTGAPGVLETTFPTVFRAKPVTTNNGMFSYIRIFTFNINDSDAFLKEFVRLVTEESMPKDGLIIDVRGNGGGLIYAAERLLQVLTPNEIEPERAQFINNQITYDICRLNAPSPYSEEFSLAPWQTSIGDAVETGATYSRGFTITNKELCNNIGQKYYGPIVLITDALCYSATDMFAAGFKDHKIGKILGIHKNTGAGGANVWTHSLLHLLMSDPESPYTPLPESPFKSLPHGTEMRVAVRRTLRVGEYSGIPIEDLGVPPDEEYQMKEDDLINGNLGLITKAAEILAKEPTYTFIVKTSLLNETRIEIKITTKNITRVDFYIDNRPLKSNDVHDETIQVELEIPERARHEPETGRLLKILGYKENELVASFKKSFYI